MADFYDPLVATETCPTPSSASARLIQMDRMYWPPFGTVIAGVAEGKVTKLLAPTTADQWIEGAAERWGLPIEVLEPL